LEICCEYVVHENHGKAAWPGDANKKSLARLPGKAIVMPRHSGAAKGDKPS
jgi:hypothetical protein